MRYSMYTDPDIYCSRGREVANAGTGSTRRIYFFSGRASVPLVANKKKKIDTDGIQGTGPVFTFRLFRESATLFPVESHHVCSFHFNARCPTFSAKWRTREITHVLLRIIGEFYILHSRFFISFLSLYLCFIYTHTNINIR